MNLTKKWIRPKLTSKPPRVLIDLKASCNLRCPMCIVHSNPEDARLKGLLNVEFSDEKLELLLAQLDPSTTMIGPSLWSEPTMSPNFEKHIRLMKEKGFEVSINTNGLLLNKNLISFLVSIQVDSICVSLDAMTSEALKRVRGITRIDKQNQRVLALLNERGNKQKPRIGVSFTKQKENEKELPQFIEKWVEVADFVRVGELFSGGSFPALRPKIERHACPVLYSTMAIQANGNVSYCCLDAYSETNLGNLNKQTVEEVWQGDLINKVREHHEKSEWDKVPFCKNCDRWSSYDVEERVVGEVLIRKSSEYVYYNSLKKMGNWSTSLKGGLHNIDPD